MAPWNEVISQALGWASVGCWLIVGFPQFYEMYKWKTGEGMSMSFLVIWGIGDILNVVGCLWADQLATQVAVAVWYLIMDGVLIAQIYYYDTCFPEKRKELLAKLKEDERITTVPDEKEPLMPEHMSPATAARQINFHDMSVPQMIASSFESAPRSFIHHSPHGTGSRGGLAGHEQGQQTTNRTTSLSGSSRQSNLHMHTMGLLAVGSLVAIYVGVGASFSDGSFKSVGRVLLGVGDETTCRNSPTMCWWGQVLGWISSFFYIFARVPQLMKNFNRKSCEGLSIWMFFFGVMGNVTYSASVFAWSLAPVFLTEHAAFIVGSLGTLAFDFAIFMQFFIYKDSIAGSGYRPIE